MLNTYASGTAALKMPRNYVPLTEEEMTYADGGFRTQWILFKSILQVHFSHSEVEMIVNNRASSIAGDILTVAGLTKYVASSASLLGAALVAAKWELKAADKINGGKGAYFRILLNGGQFSGLNAITPW